jgi:hypothetical protein
VKLTSLAVPAVLALLAGSACAQSINIDVNSHPASTVPDSDFGGAAGQAGVWNGVSSETTVPTPLLGLNGAPSGLTIVRGGQGSGATSYVPPDDYDYFKLMSDYMVATGSSVGPEFTIQNLSPGYYRIFVYAMFPGTDGIYSHMFGTEYHRNFISISLGGLLMGSAETSSNGYTGGYAPGITHARFSLMVNQPAPLKVAVKSKASDQVNLMPACALNGIQLVKYEHGRIYVDASRVNGTGNGDSWANACTDLQSALTIANTSDGHISEVWIAKGAYYPTAGADRTASFHLIDGVKIRGGFAGTETTLAQRDLSQEENTTYLSGDIGTRRNSSDNSYRVITGVLLGSGTLLESVTIVGGKANGVQANGHRDGSLMYLVQSAAAVKDCVFSTGDSLSRGGAVFVNGGAMQFSGCEFQSNWGHQQGGAIYWTSAAGQNPPSLKIMNCSFIGNDAQLGASIHATGGTPTISNCVFSGNEGTTIVAMDNVYASDSMTLHNCTFSGNKGSIFGSIGDSVQKFNNCIIWNNDWATAFTPLTKTGWASVHAQGVSLVNTCMQGYYAAGVPGLGINGLDPMFVDADGPDNLMGTWDDDLRLSPVSPLIDIGLNAYAPLDICDLDGDGNVSEGAPFDLDGNPRFFNVPFATDGLGFGARIDFGAYEAQYTTLPCGTSDFNGDGDFGTDADIEAFFACLGGSCCEGCYANGSDFNADGDYGTDADIESFFRVLGGGSC